MSIEEVKDLSMEQKLGMNKTVCKIIECVYMQELYQSISSGEKLIVELSPEEYLKISEIIRDELTTYSSHIVLQIVRCLNETKYEEYVNYVIFNLYYYLYLFRNEDYMVCSDMVEELNRLNKKVVDDRIKEALLYLIRENIEKYKL